MKRIVFLGLVLMLFTSGFTTPTASAASRSKSKPPVTPQAFSVLVGWGDTTRGVNFETYFPGTLHVHVGDSVTWNLNAKEIHTVTFLAPGQTVPVLLMNAPSNPYGSPVMFNPQAAFPVVPTDAMYDGSTYTNSGVMGPDPTQPKQFSLTFTKLGTYTYICLVHGVEMSGSIVVEAASREILTPVQVKREANREIEKLKGQIASAEANARKSVKHAVRNPDHSLTHFVMVGYSQGVIDLMQFFPRQLEVRQGDTVQWYLPMDSMAMPMLMPHTITFLNGTADPALALPVSQGPELPPLLVLNPVVVFPAGSDTLTRSGLYNSGILDPTQPGPLSYTLKIGDIHGSIVYQCLLHDDSGMIASLKVEH